MNVFSTFCDCGQERLYFVRLLMTKSLSYIQSFLSDTVAQDGIHIVPQTDSIYIASKKTLQFTLQGIDGEQGKGFPFVADVDIAAFGLLSTGYRAKYP